jgi:hypothetical protein
MDDLKKVVALRKYNVFIPKLFNLIRNMNHAQQVRLLEKAEELFSKERRVDQRRSCRIT